jgi:hypothetical protein
VTVKHRKSQLVPGRSIFSTVLIRDQTGNVATTLMAAGMVLL